MSRSPELRKKKWDKNECIDLFREVFRNREKFALSLISKEESSWEAIVQQLNAKGIAVSTDQAKSKWSRISTKFNHGYLKGLSQHA